MVFVFMLLRTLEADAGLHHADRTDDPLGDPVALGDGGAQVVVFVVQA